MLPKFTFVWSSPTLLVICTSADINTARDNYQAKYGTAVADRIYANPLMTFSSDPTQPDFATRHINT